MKTRLALAAAALAGSGTIGLMARSPQVQPSKQEGKSSNQMLMRDKLMHASKILEGITLENFDLVGEHAKTLGMISRATTWHVTPTPQYTRLAKNFQEQCLDLERHAKEKNVEAATLDLVRINVTCTDCHQHMREEVKRRQ
jgi:hypothetical protein